MKVNRLLKRSIYLVCFLLLAFLVNNIAFASDEARKIGRTRWEKIRKGVLRASFATQTNKTSSSLSYTFPFPTPIIVKPSKDNKNNYVRVYIEGLEQWDGNYGAPILPFKPVKLLIPYGTRVVKVEVKEGASKVLPGEYILEAAQKPVPLSQIHKAKPTLPDPVIYSSDEPYPTFPSGDAFIQRAHGYQILHINLIPVVYNPLSRRLAYYESISVIVYFETIAPQWKKSQSILAPNRKRPRLKITPTAKYRKKIKRLVNNPDIIDTYNVVTKEYTIDSTIDTTGISSPEGEMPMDYYSLPPGECKYLIITSEALARANVEEPDIPGETSGSYSFRDLINSKEERGLTAAIVSVEWIEANYDGTRPDGNTDIQTAIRNCIIDAYENHGTEYVLLGGDKDVIPPRRFYVESWPGGYTALMPADMYYACLDGTFDGNHDGMYGGPEDGEQESSTPDVDLYAEVFVGRAPVATADEISNFVRKTLAYENATSPYLNTVYMVGEHLGFGGVSEYAADSLEEIRLGSSAHNYTTVGFENSQYADFFDTYTLYDKDQVWDKSELIDIINSGVHILNHLGHANTTYDMKLETSDLSSLTNTDYPFIYSQGCLPGAFDTDECFAEVITTMEEGAFAVVMNARYGWGEGYSTAGPSQYYNREFWDTFLGEGLNNLGVMNQVSKEENVNRINGDCMRWCYYELNLFGDPELPIMMLPSNGLIKHKVTFSEADGNGDGHIDAGESVEMVAELKAFNDDFYNVSATLTSDDQYVSIENGFSAFGVINRNQVVDNQYEPFRFVIANDCPRGHIINFELLIESTGYSETKPVSVKVFTYWPFEFGIGLSHYDEYHPAIADLDGDGNVEIIVSAGTNGLYCINKEGQVIWRYFIHGGFHADRQTPAIADIIGNGEGNLEVIFGGGKYISPEIGYVGYLFCLDKDGNLIWEIENLNIHSSPVVADLNNDGEVEILVTTWGYLYCLDKNGNIVWKFKTDKGPIKTSPGVADLIDNGEGNLEIIIGSAANSGLNYVYCIDNNGNEIWRYWDDSYNKPRYYATPTIADLDNDGNMEILVGPICLSKEGEFLWKFTYGAYSQKLPTGSPAVADLIDNGSGNLEIVFKGNRDIVCADKDGNELWRTYVDTPYTDPVAVDLDGDGAIEIVVAHRKGVEDGDGVSHYKVLTCLDNEGNEVWSYIMGEAYSNGSWGSSIAVADLDGDGGIEILLGYSSYHPRLHCVNKDGEVFFPLASPQPTLDPMPWPMFQHDIRHTGYYEPPRPPAPPSNLRARFSSNGKGWVRLLWQDNSNNETGFRIYRQCGPEVTEHTVPANREAYLDKRVEVNKAYQYWVSAINAAGEVNSESIWIMIPAPAELHTVKTGFDGEVELRWSDTSINEYGYRVYRQYADKKVRLAVLGPNTDTFTDYHAQTGLTYTYWVQAFTNIAGGIDSNKVTLTVTIPENLVFNGNVEQGTTTPTGWHTYNNLLTDQTGWVQNTYNSPEHSLAIYNFRGENAGWRGNEIVFDGDYGRSFTFGGWSKGYVSGGLYCLDFRVEFTDGTVQWFFPQELRFSYGWHGWEHKSVTVTFDKPVKKIRPYCLLYCSSSYGGGWGAAWFDDIYVYRHF